MKWFSKKEGEEEQPEEETEMKMVAVDAQALYRSVLYDTAVPDPEKIAHVLGMTPVSEEVGEMEEQESNRRTEALEGMLPLIDTLARQAANINAVHHLSLNSVDDVGEDAAKVLQAYYGVALSTLFSSLSILADLEFISINVEGTLRMPRV